MNPGLFTNLQIINCTNTPLATSGVSSYQMSSWFPGNNPLLNARTYSQNPSSYLLQFLSGDDEGDDAGNITMVWGAYNFLLYGGSNASGHYIQLRDISPSDTFVIGVVATGSWPTSAESASSITWSSSNVSSVDFGSLTVPGTTQQALAIVDLSQIYPLAPLGDVPSYQQIQQAIQSNQLSAQQAEDLWLQVSAYTQIMPPSLTYSLSDVVFANSPPTETSQDTVFSTQVEFDTGTYTNTFTITNTYENSVTLTTDTVWSFGAEIEIDVPLSFLPGVTFNTSFEAGSSEASVTTQNQSQQFSQEIELSVPGTYQINGFLSIDDDFTTTYTGTLLVIGSLLGIPINGTVLSALIMTQGWNIPPASTIVNPVSVTATVLGSVTGNIAFNGRFTETKLS